MPLPFRLPLWRISLLVLVAGSVLWLGGSIVRAVIGSELLKAGTLELESFIAPEAEREIHRLLARTGIVVLGGYLAVLAGGILFLALSPFRLREHGWLMMSALLFFLSLPVEAYVMYLDGRIIYHDLFTTAGNETFRTLFLDRMRALGGAPFVAQLCYYTVILLAVFQPMRKPPPAQEP
ncbi:MAG: hypothetical protein WB626_06390 [Bacteroidota bacterium]